MLRAAMADAFKIIGSATPSWPDPYLSGEPVPDDGLCRNPGKFRIFAARAEAWAKTASDAGLVDVDRIPDSADLWREAPWSEPTQPWREALWSEPADRVIRLRPRRDGAVPLLFAFRPIEDEHDAVMVVGAGGPAVGIATYPECPCDACDAGSTALLEEFDDLVLTVATGALVHVTTPEFETQTTLRGTTMEGSVTGASRQMFEDLFAEARAGRSPHQIVHGRRWW